jgi:hypothetical protein
MAADLEGKEACELTARCMFLEDPGEDVEFAQSVCEISEENNMHLRNFAELAFEINDYMWTSWSDVRTADACLAKVGSTARWQGKGELTGTVGLVLYVVFADSCWGYGTFYGLEDPTVASRHKEHDGVDEGSAVGKIRRAWYMCPVPDTVLNPLDVQSSGSNVSWKFMGRTMIEEEQVHRSFMCILDTCPDVPGCLETFSGVEDCYRSCPPGQAPGGDLALAGMDEIVECRNRKPVVETPCEPFPCKSPLGLPGVLSVDNHESGGDCQGDDISNGTTCHVSCRSLHFFFDQDYDGTEAATVYYPRSLPFQCTSGTFQMAVHPDSLLPALKSSPRGVLGSEYQCLLQGSTATTVQAVSATMGLKMSKADVALLLEEEEKTITALEESLRKAVASTEATVKVLPPLAEVADTAQGRRLSEPAATSILRAQFVAYSPDGKSTPESIATAINDFRADEEAMKAQFTESLKAAGLPVTVLGVSMSEPAVINYNVVTKPEKSLEEITRERMRDVAMLGSVVSLFVIVLCVFWQQIRPCICFVGHKLNCVRIFREFQEKKKAAKQAKKMAKKQKSLQIEFVP